MQSGRKLLAAYQQRTRRGPKVPLSTFSVIYLHSVFKYTLKKLSGISIDHVKKENILFLCTGNSCRSQMAEALYRDLRGKFYEVYSASIERHGLNSRAVAGYRELMLLLRPGVCLDQAI